MTPDDPEQSLPSDFYAESPSIEHANQLKIPGGSFQDNASCAFNFNRLPAYSSGGCTLQSAAPQACPNTEVYADERGVPKQVAGNMDADLPSLIMDPSIFQLPNLDLNGVPAIYEAPSFAARSPTDSSWASVFENLDCNTQVNNQPSESRSSLEEVSEEKMEDFRRAREGDDRSNHPRKNTSHENSRTCYYGPWSTCYSQREHLLLDNGKDCSHYNSVPVGHITNSGCQSKRTSAASFFNTIQLKPNRQDGVKVERNDELESESKLVSQCQPNGVPSTKSESTPGKIIGRHSQTSEMTWEKCKNTCILSYSDSLADAPAEQEEEVEDEEDEDEDEEDEEDVWVAQVDTYFETLRYFRLLNRHCPSDAVDSQSSSDGRAGVVASSSRTETPAGSCLTARGVATDRSDSSGGSEVAVSLQNREELVFHPLELMCWHAAGGVRCNGKNKRQTTTHRLWEDHSLSKSPTTHKLPPKCGRCELLFASAKEAQDHEKLLKSDPPCPRLGKKEVDSLNEPLERVGISEDVKRRVGNALKAFRNDQKLPAGLDDQFFTNWVCRNTELYIGKSTAEPKTAKVELSKWLVIFCTLFPHSRIPSNPFVEFSEIEKHDRIVDLCNASFSSYSKEGLLPPFDREHQARLQSIVIEAIETSAARTLLDQGRKGKPKRSPRKKRKRDTDDQDMMDALSNVSLLPPTPAPPRTTNTFEADLHATGALTQPSPGTAMAPPPTPDFTGFQTPGTPFRTPQNTMELPLHESPYAARMHGIHDDPEIQDIMRHYEMFGSRPT